jgi:hypothetical protein
MPPANFIEIESDPNTDPLRGDIASNSGSDAISMMFTAAQVAPINLA